MGIIYKDKYNIIYNPKNDHIPIDFPVGAPPHPNRLLIERGLL